jgi:hypothetical protein
MGNDIENFISVVGERSGEAWLEYFEPITKEHPNFCKLCEIDIVNKSFFKVQLYSKNVPEYSNLVDLSLKYNLFIKNEFIDEHGQNGQGLIIINKGNTEVNIKYMDWSYNCFVR